MNDFKTGMLMAAMTGLFLAAGYLLGGELGIAIAFVVAGAMNLLAYWNSDRMVLGMHGARTVNARSAPQLVGLVETLAGAASPRGPWS